MSAPSSLATLTQALQLSALPMHEQEEILRDIDDLIFKGSLVKLIEKMDAATRIAFSKLLDHEEANGEKIDLFIRKHVPDADKVVKDTISELTSDILAVTQE